MIYKQDATAPAASRLSLSEILRMMLTRRAADRSGSKLTRNAKGDYQYEVTVVAGEVDGIDTPEQCVRETMRLADILDDRYPGPNGARVPVPTEPEQPKRRAAAAERAKGKGV
jgi:hypothetical protein